MIEWLQIRWRIYRIEFVLMAVLVVLLGFCGLMAYREIASTDEHYQAFMSDCQRDHKHYECEVLWRQGENAPSTVPVPIVIPVHQ